MDKVEHLRASLSRLRNHGRTWTELSNECGIDRTWLEKFANAKIQEPTVTRYDVLTAMVERLNGTAQS